MAQQRYSFAIPALDVQGIGDYSCESAPPLVKHQRIRKRHLKASYEELQSKKKLRAYDPDAVTENELFDAKKRHHALMNVHSALAYPDADMPVWAQTMRDELRQSLNTIKEDLTTVKKDLTTIKKDLTTIKKDLTTAQNSLDTLDEFKKVTNASLHNFGVRANNRLGDRTFIPLVVCKSGGASIGRAPSDRFPSTPGEVGEMTARQIGYLRKFYNDDMGILLGKDGDSIGEQRMKVLEWITYG
eukprot:TRINITY_DN4705_c0_g1_i1.p1 TRINITY_DN4705_c0_g1~~TRINITY_DN4705_c0_g1_i1.p1  ORF type:complete len:266 (-),score=46.10 TRINITY_DN4705_c0_g1_i1:149-877(-)